MFLWLCYHWSKLNLTMVKKSPSNEVVVGLLNFLIDWNLDTVNMVLLFSQQTFVGLQDVLKTPSRHALKTYSTRLQRNNFSSSKTSWRRLANTFWRPLEDVLKTSCKTSWRSLERRKIITLKTSWRRLEDMSWRRLEDVFKTNKMFTGDICI